MHVSDAYVRDLRRVILPKSWSFDKLHEVGDLSYFGFTLYLSVL